MTVLIARLETTKLLRHPIIPMLMALTMGLLWLFFYRLFVDYLTLMQNALVQGSRHASLSVEVVKPLFSWSIVVLAFILPLFTTIAFSVEMQQRTFYLWATHPIRPFDLVIGKYLCILGMTTLILLGLLLMICTLQIEASLDWGMVMGGCFALLGVSSALISFGLFVSCLTSSPLLAIGITVVGNLMWLLIEWLSPFSATLLPARELSLLGHSFHLLHGHFQSIDVAFYLFFTIFWLLMSARVLRFKMKRVL